MAEMAQELIWLSTKEAARRLGITPRTLYRLIDEGQIPAYKFGRVIRLKADEVDDFVDAARIVPGDLGHLYNDAAATSGRRASSPARGAREH